MNIAIVSIWFRRGQTYVALQAREALKNAGHNVHVFARTGAVGGVPMMDTEGELSVNNFTSYPEYVIKPDDLEKYLTDNEIDAVLFLEEQWQQGLGAVCNKLGIFCANIIVWETFHGADDLWKEHYRQFDSLMFQIHAGYEVAQYLDYHNVQKIPWGIDLNIWNRGTVPIQRKSNELRFIHSAGWGGMFQRKQTALVIDAFAELESTLKDKARLLVHLQDTTNHNQVLKEVNGNITVYKGNIKQETLVNFYRHSDVAIICSKWEGLGLNLLEPQGMGIPVITTDDAPMNEWINNDHNGFVCDVEERKSYKGVAILGSHVSKENLKEKIMTYVNDRACLKRHSKNARRNAKYNLNWEKNGVIFSEIFERLVAKKKKEKIS